MKKTLSIAVIGLGQRGMGLLRPILHMKDVNVVAVCDSYQDRIEQAQKLSKKLGRDLPRGYVDYKELVEKESIEAVIISCSWKCHTEISLYCMEKGIPVGCEVGGVHDINECWALVDTYKKTQTPYMFLENCCYGEYELACLNMVKKGLFGKVVSCEGGYKHDLRDEISGGALNRHYRLEEYINSNCENYPTHEIGPIAKILDINRGNRMVELVSISSKAVGLNEYVKDNLDKEHIKKLEDIVFKQGDIVNTLIKCENGETISISLDTTLPRPYSRGFTVHGTRMLYSEEGNYYFDDKNKLHKAFHWIPSKFFNNGRKMARKYRHEIWKNFKRHPVKSGHGGMDYLVLRAFFESVLQGHKVMPLDVYDAVTWMAITALSAKSIETGTIVEFPDFTRGAYKERKTEKFNVWYI